MLALADPGVLQAFAASAGFVFQMLSASRTTGMVVAAASLLVVLITRVVRRVW